jgi:hypothetical protein
MLYACLFPEFFESLGEMVADETDLISRQPGREKGERSQGKVLKEFVVNQRKLLTTPFFDLNFINVDWEPEPIIDVALFDTHVARSFLLFVQVDNCDHSKQL